MPAPIPRLKPPVNGQHIDNRFQFVPGNNNKKSIVFSKLNAGYNTIRVQTNKQTNRQADRRKKSGQMTLALTKLTRQDLKSEFSSFCFCLVIILTDECDFCVSIT